MPQEVTKPTTKRDLPKEIMLAVQACLEKKAEGLSILELRELSSFTDYFLIMHGNSTRQNAAIAEGIEGELKKTGIRPLSVEGRDSADWT